MRQIRLDVLIVSIHAPTWGATLHDAKAVVKYLSFNPRAHVGRDNLSAWFYPIFNVSIHAPTWGATPFRRSAASIS